MEHSQRILQIIKERGTTEYRIAKDTGISDSLFAKWKEKPTSKISSEKLVLIADYFGCSIDYLVGRTENPDVNR